VPIDDRYRLPRATFPALVVFSLAACAPNFPPRAPSVDLAGEPVACPDFRAARVDAPWDVLRRPALPSHTTPLGCATDRALRVMVADPADLAGGETGPARAMTAGPAVGRYAAGAVKQPPAVATTGGSE
jgi:hypothetical protein